MNKDIEKVVLTKEQIYEKVCKIGDQISKDYASKELLIVVILKGAAIFAADLFRSISIPCIIDYMSVSSYDGTGTTGNVKIIKDLDYNIEDKDILIVEDIIDSGITLDYLCRLFKIRGAKGVKIATLLDKPSNRKIDVPVDYIGFSVPNEFLVGYGLDYNEKYRNIPYIGILKTSIYQK